MAIVTIFFRISSVICGHIFRVQCLFYNFKTPEDCDGSDEHVIFLL